MVGIGRVINSPDFASVVQELKEETVIACSDSVHSVCFTVGVDEIIRIIREQIAEKLHVLIGVLVVCVYACRENPFG